MTKEYFTREKQIADKLKEEMAALNRRIERLNQWKESGYQEPCQSHIWELIDAPQQAIYNIPADPTIYVLRFKCHRCGMTMAQQAVVEQETLFDEWQEYRENKGEEEE